MDKIEPKFFLQDELIYFLKKNMDLLVVVNPVSPSVHSIDARIFICNQEITVSTSTIILPPPSLIGGMTPLKMEQTLKEQEAKVATMFHDVYMLTQHMHGQEEEIKKLKQEIHDLKTSPVSG